MDVGFPTNCCVFLVTLVLLANIQVSLMVREDCILTKYLRSTSLIEIILNIHNDEGDDDGGHHFG